MAAIFLVMGTPASGKSTVSRALARRFPLGLHLAVDDLRQNVVSGRADMDALPSSALSLQLRLARESAAHTARAYAAEGFAVVLDDFWLGHTPEADYLRVLGPQFQRVLLLPSLAVTLERLYGRRPEEGSFKGVLAGVIPGLHAEISAHPRQGWHTVDSSALDVEGTVDRILEQTGTLSGSGA